MLYNLHVKNYAIIEETDVFFDKGLNILTGETGAGKSILIGSINAALGGKLSKDMIRNGADSASVELAFDEIPDELKEMLTEEGIEVSDELILQRKILSTGKSVAKINGEMVNSSKLKEVAGYLIDIHGQHEHHSLLKKSNHMELLDRYGGAETEKLKAETKALYEEYSALLHEYESADISGDERERKVSVLRFETEEIETARLVPGEDERLEERFRVLSNAQNIKEDVEKGLSYISGDNDGNAMQSVDGAIRELSRAVKLDDELQSVYDSLNSVSDILQDAFRELEAYHDGLEGFEEEYAEISERLDLLNKLKYKYGHTIENVIRYGENAQAELEKYEQFDQYIETLKRKLDKKYSEYMSVAQKLSAVRKQYESKLSKAICAACEDLNFSEVIFNMQFDDDQKPSANGIDRGEFYISLNKGEPVRPLTQVASGGELSRIMLAFKSVLAKEDSIPTLIFDEIDTGISGRTAQSVAEKMAFIASEHQLISITHLPQIAAMADHSFVIEKTVEGDKTKTAIEKLSEDESVRELARLLGGATITDSVLVNAREMKALAMKVKSER